MKMQRIITIIKRNSATMNENVQLSVGKDEIRAELDRSDYRKCSLTVQVNTFQDRIENNIAG